MTVRLHSVLRSSPSRFSNVGKDTLASSVLNDARESWAGETPRTNVSFIFAFIVCERELIELC